MNEDQSKQLAADIAANIVKETAKTTARDLDIQALQINYKAMFEQNAKEHSEVKAALSEMANKLDKLIDKMDKRYAGIWVEKLIIALGYLIAFSAVGYLASLIYKATVVLK